MDVTVSELLEQFLQSPLVTWVSRGVRRGEAAGPVEGVWGGEALSELSSPHTNAAILPPGR